MLLIVIHCDLYNYESITYNTYVESLIVYGATVLFFFSVLPVYVSVYVYADSGKKYASVNFCIYRFLRFLNINSAEDGHSMQINGKDAEIDIPLAMKDAKIALDNTCLFKIIQLSDYGMLRESNTYAALLQGAITFPLYTYLKRSGSKCKLKNYTIFNMEHSELEYAAKVVSVINLIVAIKILIIMLMERIHEN